MVAKGYSHLEGIDFGKIFSPIEKFNSIRFLLSLAATFDLKVAKMDAMFLHGDMDEEIYMKQPKGFILKHKKELVCKLKKSIYGLK